MRGVSREEIEEILSESRAMEAVAREKRVLNVLEDKILATLFFEPSTRTHFSFQTAMLRLGGKVIGFSDEQATSVAKGESIRDTIKFIEACADAVVIRHPLDGTAQLAAEAAGVPVINAGDGANQHPTQALLDLHTIIAEKGKIDGLEILLLGDLKYGRTVHSLAYALANYDVKLLLYSPPALKMPTQLVNELRSSVKIRELTKMDLGEADVVYATRIQKERFADPDEYKKYAYELDAEKLKEMKEDAALLHPFPRVGEIAPEIDGDARAAYFRQEANGIPVRMALLKKILAEKG